MIYSPVQRKSDNGREGERKRPRSIHRSASIIYRGNITGVSSAIRHRQCQTMRVALEHAKNVRPNCISDEFNARSRATFRINTVVKDFPHLICNLRLIP